MAGDSGDAECGENGSLAGRPDAGGVHRSWSVGYCQSAVKASCIISDSTKLVVKGMVLGSIGSNSVPLFARQEFDQVQPVCPYRITVAGHQNDGLFGLASRLILR